MPPLPNGKLHVRLLYLYNNSPLFLEINALYSLTHGSKHFVGNGSEHITQHRYGQVVAENLYRITLFAINVGHVYHTHIHTNITDVRSFLPVNQTIAMAAAQMTVEPVSIANRNGCNTAFARQMTTTTVAHRIFRTYFVNLKYSGF